MIKSFIVSCLASVTLLSVFAAPLAPVTYVDNVASNVLREAKRYTDTHTPDIDLSAFVAKTNADLRVDSATNVVWKCVWSNGVEYIFAYSNNTNILKGAAK
jgi:hypothetical protein